VRDEQRHEPAIASNLAVRGAANLHSPTVSSPIVTHHRSDGVIVYVSTQRGTGWRLGNCCETVTRRVLCHGIAHRGGQRLDGLRGRGGGISEVAIYR
jgi:hypothetical protein